MSTETRKGRRRISWRGIGCGALALLAVGGTIGLLFARSAIVRPPEGSGELRPVVVVVERGDLIESVQLNAALEPADQASVSFGEGALVTELLVAEGEQVRAGQVLARLATRDLELRLASAEARQAQSEQALAELEAGPTEAQLAQAVARVARARADLAGVDDDLRPIDIELAAARLAQARQDLAELQAGEPTSGISAAEDQLEAAEAGLLSSQRALEDARDGASRAKTSAFQALQQGVQELARVQLAYSDAFWDWDYVQRTGRHPRDRVADAAGRLVNRELEPFEIEQFRRTFEDAKVNLANAETSLQNLQEAYDQAREDEVEQVQAAERDVAAAERALAEAEVALGRERTRGLDAALLEARAEVAEAEKAYNDLTNDPARPARQIELEAALLEAIAAEEQLRAGPDPVELAQARTALEEARAAVAEAEADLAAATLRAPIAGTIVDITITPGTRTSGQDAVVIADLERLLLRGQVTEQDVTRVAVGQKVRVSVDSLPGQEFLGELVRVSELPANSGQSSGDPFSGGFGPGGPGMALGGLYPVEIVIAAGDERLRVGMAATAAIVTLAIPDTLFIPLQAVIEGPDGPYVLRVTGPAGPEGTPPTEQVPVEVGASSGDRIQVLGGLSAGDELLLQELPPMEMLPAGPIF